MAGGHCEVCGERGYGWSSVCRVEIHSPNFNPRRDMCEECFEVLKGAVRRALRFGVIRKEPPDEARACRDLRIVPGVEAPPR